MPASPNAGVNTLTGEGLAEVLNWQRVGVDVSNDVEDWLLAEQESKYHYA
jgi:hypothetical protein